MTWNEEPYRREIHRNLEDPSDDEMRARPARSVEEVQEYRDRVNTWMGAIFSQYTTSWDGPFTGEAMDRLDKEMDAIPVKVRRVLTRLRLQSDVLGWVLNTSLDDLVEETRDKVEEAGVDMYELEDRWSDEEGAASWEVPSGEW